MKRVLLSIPGPKGGIIWDNGDGSYTWTAAAMDDTDGSGPLHGDPDGQRSTTLGKGGFPLDADIDHYVVVPEQFPRMIGPVVLGCRATVLNHSTGLQDPFAVVGDLGPRGKLGEYANIVNETIGVPYSPTTGGTSLHIVECTIWPGIAADGYTLQPL